jgi:hypothetical protein
VLSRIAWRVSVILIDGTFLAEQVYGVEGR